MLLDGLMTRQADVYHVRSPYVYTSVMDVMAGFALSTSHIWVALKDHTTSSPTAAREQTHPSASLAS